MADSKSLGLDDIVNRPGTYFNPQTEVLIIVDELLERFQVHYHPGAVTDNGDDELDDELEEDDQEPGRDD